MKILHAGNMANLAYVICRQLQRNGINVELIMDSNPHKGSDPLRFDPELKNKYPNWVHFFNKKKSNWKIDLIWKMRERKYDIIHSYVEFPIFASFTNKPFIAHTQGSDFRELAKSKSLKGILLRRAYKKAKVILFFQPDHLPIFTELKLKNGIFLPPLWDTSFFTSKQIDRDDSKFIIFHPANLEFRLKGNEKLIEGFSKFVTENKNSELIIVDRGADSENVHNLVKKYNIQNFVKFVKGPLNSKELLAYYNSSDVIADQFELGALGSIGWEAFSCKKPLLAYVNQVQYENVYGESPPVANASNAIEVKNMLEILKEKKFSKTLGEKGYEWIIKYHSPQIFTKKIIKIYELILDRKSIDVIRKELSEIT